MAKNQFNEIELLFIDVAQKHSIEASNYSSVNSISEHLEQFFSSSDVNASLVRSLLNKLKQTISIEDFSKNWNHYNQIERANVNSRALQNNIVNKVSDITSVRTSTYI